MRRRSNGEGSIYYDAEHGLYQYRISYMDNYGKTHRKAFYAKKASDARKKGKDWLVTYEKANRAASVNPYTSDWLQTWLNTYVQGAVRAATYEKYLSCLKPVMQAFENMRLNKLNPTLLQQFFQQQLLNGGYRGQGLAPVTVRNQRRYLSSCLDMAVRLGLTTQNPVKLTKPPKVEKAEIKPLSECEVNQLLSVARENLSLVKESDNWGNIMGESDLYIGVMIAIFTGMRLGEIMALKWSDLNVSTSSIAVQRSKSDVKGQSITSPKTGAGRKIQIGQDLLVALQEHRTLQKNYRQFIGNTYNNNEWIIGGLYGNGYNKRHYSSRKFQKLLKQANISRHIRFHDLRHTHATLLLLAGINPKIVQERLGHASIDMTLDTYSHLTLANQEIAVNALDRILESSNL